jgi:hypothetical protein
MAEVTPPSYLQNGAHSALSDRLTVSGLLQPGASGLISRGGIRATGNGLGLAVRAAATANNTVIVGAGTAFVPESDGTGVYVAHNDADKTLTVPAASTTQSRRDIVVAQVRDSTISGANDDWVLQVVSGTPSSGTPVAPAVPANALALADYLVPAGSSTVVTSANINDRRANVTALGGIMTVLSTALPANPYRGMAVWCTDTEEMRVWNGSLWRIQPYAPLPDPTISFYNGDCVQTGAANTFTILSPRVTLAYTATRATWVLLGLHCWINSVTGNDGRAAIFASGATTGQGTGGIIQDNGNWGEVPTVSDNVQAQVGVSFPYKVNPGTTTFEVRGYRYSTASSPNVRFPALRVTPLRYA